MVGSEVRRDFAMLMGVVDEYFSLSPAIRADAKVVEKMQKFLARNISIWGVAWRTTSTSAAGLEKCGDC
jgi:hypothetical protein